MLLVLAALVGLAVSAASSVFLEGVPELQEWVYEDLPESSVITRLRSGGRCRRWVSPGC